MANATHAMRVSTYRSEAFPELAVLEARLAALVDRYQRLTGRTELTASQWSTVSVLHGTANALTVARDAVTVARHRARMGYVGREHLYRPSSDLDWAERRLDSAERIVARCAYCRTLTDWPESNDWERDEDNAWRCSACSQRVCKDSGERPCACASDDAA